MTILEAGLHLSDSHQAERFLSSPSHAWLLLYLAENNGIDRAAESWQADECAQLSE
jgi:hypothetical protein